MLSPSLPLPTNSLQFPFPTMTMVRTGAVRLLLPRALSSLLLHTFLLSSFMALSSSSHVGNETDRLALLSFKNKISHDPLRVMSSWNDSLHFCHWSGVTCGRLHRQRVTSLNLPSHGLVGLISPHIANLSFLIELNLSTNNFHGGIPPEMGQLLRLKHIDLGANSLQGEVSANLTTCKNLRLVFLNENKLTGRIPIELISPSKLRSLDLSKNDFFGAIPPSFGNISTLMGLYLAENSLEGGIPEDLGRLSSLQRLQMGANNLSGTIPPSLYNLSSITHLFFPINQLHGILPPDLGLALPRLQVLVLADNRFTGPIPMSLANASRLENIGLGVNDFSGSVPVNLGHLRSLRIVRLGDNRLRSKEGDDLSFITSLTNCSVLERLELSKNLFAGTLPASVENLSTRLSYLGLQDNQISGSIPDGIVNLISLSSLKMWNNSLVGTIPVGIGKLGELVDLYLDDNELSGPIPSSIGNLTKLAILSLEGNGLQGSLPHSLTKCRSLQGVFLGYNKLNGSIPKKIASFLHLVELDMSENHFTGSLPEGIGKLEQLGALSVSNNNLTGEIPSSLGNCLNLIQLNVSGNSFHGVIPQSLSALRGIEMIDLSRNKMTGQIPKYLGNFSFLQYLDLSINDFEAEVPTQGVFGNASKFSMVGNSKLCGGIPELKLPSCPKPNQNSSNHGGNHSLKIIISVVGSVALLCFLLLGSFAAFHWRNKSRKKATSSIPSVENQHLQVSYSDLLKATDGFNSANLIGVGSYGSVYKGVLDRDGTVIAVKVLNLQRRGAIKSFIAECEALRSIRHRNLVKIVSACSSIDFKGNDFRALVYEYMNNGSLEQWLHPNMSQQHEMSHLSFIQRLNIAIDVASALDYLHRCYDRPLVHCDLKPSNVLLDNDMTAHVADFGLARFLSEASINLSQSQTSSLGIKGTIGYVAPEYGMGEQVSIHGDVYSFGILLLEMFTGKRPSDDVFKDTFSLHQFVKIALPQQVLEITDPRLLSEDVEADNHESDNNKRSIMQKCLLSVMKIGVSCSMEAPKERMEMRDVVTELHKIKELYLGIRVHRDIQSRDVLLGEGPSNLNNY